MSHKKKSPFTVMSASQLRRRRVRLARQVPDVQITLRGSLQSQSRRCGKGACRCAQGELHGPYVYLSVRAGGRSGLLYVPADLTEEVTRHVELTGQIEAALAEISAINLELLSRGELD
jgi:hypothetical protein